MLRIFILLLFIISTTFSWSDEALVIGVMEEQSSYNRKPVVRPLFMKNDKSWTTLNSKETYSQAKSPNTLKWNLVFDGRNLGEITSSGLNSDTHKGNFSRDNYLIVLSTESVPKLGNKEKRFWKWGGLPENRPIAINTYPYYSDPEKWKRSRIDAFHPSLKQQVFVKLKSIIGNAFHCNGAPNWDSSEIEVEIGDIDIFKVYKNSSNEVIFSAGLAVKHRKDCDGPIDGTSMPIWFYLDRGLKIIGYELDLLEVADFDNDGNVEFLFSHSGYNEDGYTLYESDFSQRHDYYWGYH